MKKPLLRKHRCLATLDIKPSSETTRLRFVFVPGQKLILFWRGDPLLINMKSGTVTTLSSQAHFS